MRAEPKWDSFEVSIQKSEIEKLMRKGRYFEAIKTLRASRLPEQEAIRLRAAWETFKAHGLFHDPISGKFFRAPTKGTIDVTKLPQGAFQK